MLNTEPYYNFQLHDFGTDAERRKLRSKLRWNAGETMDRFKDRYSSEEELMWAAFEVLESRIKRGRSHIPLSELSRIGLAWGHGLVGDKFLLDYLPCLLYTSPSPRD